MNIAIMIPFNLKTAIEGFVSFVIFLGPGDNTNFKSLNPAIKLKVFCVFF